MAGPSTVAEFLGLVNKSKLVSDRSLSDCLSRCNGSNRPEKVTDLATVLVREKLLTTYQAAQLLQGKWDCFAIGPYKIIERLGAGAASNVYLCERPVTHARVAVKVLTKLQGVDSTTLPRFYREARAAGLLVHPNIVRAHDVDQDAERQDHFMVMDFVDGSSIQDIVARFGPMDMTRSAHYIRQAALGLQYAHEKGLVHRDIKPANLMIDRRGQVRILDMGLARFEQEGGVLTRGAVLGAPEYLAPEQAVDSHNVDTRADVYSLGGTFYFMLTGQPPYAEEKGPTQKLLAKQARDPQPLARLRRDARPDLIAVVERMMTRDLNRRYRTPGEVAEALVPWTKTAIPPPPKAEMPRLSPVNAALGPLPATPPSADKSSTERMTPAPAKARAAPGPTVSATPEGRPLVPSPPPAAKPADAEAAPGTPDQTETRRARWCRRFVDWLLANKSAHGR
jgi:eukaryotic-like serine/threonine-protein kinase